MTIWETAERLPVLVDAGYSSGHECPKRPAKSFARVVLVKVNKAGWPNWDVQFGIGALAAGECLGGRKCRTDGDPVVPMVLRRQPAGPGRYAWGWTCFVCGWCHWQNKTPDDWFASLTDWTGRSLDAADNLGLIWIDGKPWRTDRAQQEGRLTQQT